MVASDGGIPCDHPRGAGTFTRVLGRFVREQHLFSLEEAVRKMTSLPASRMKLSDRGRVAPGMKADLVLFNPEDGHRSLHLRGAAQLSEGIVFDGRQWRGGLGRAARRRARSRAAC